MTSKAHQLPLIPERYVNAKSAETVSISNFVEPSGWNEQFPAYAHQLRGLLWMYFAEKGVLADEVGLGKTIQTLLLVQFLKSRKQPHRTIIVCGPRTVTQWRDEAKKFTNLSVAVAQGEKTWRISQYHQNWDILILSYPILLRDISILASLYKDVVVYDEGSAFRHHEIKTKAAALELSKNTPRVIILDATPIQNSLMDLHSLFEVLHLENFPSKISFERSYVLRGAKDRRGFRPIVGYKNTSQLKSHVYPYILRRRSNEITDEKTARGVTLPTVIPDRKILELYPEQQKIYSDARTGLIELWDKGLKHEVRAHFHHLLYAADWTGYFPGDTHNKSIKLDVIMDLLNNELSGEQVVIYSRYLGIIEELQRRLTRSNITYSRYTGKESIQQTDLAQKSFKSGESRILLGTSSLERGLNLQNARYLICIDQLLNPQRLTQLVGRIRRIGSKYDRVTVIMLLADKTIEIKLDKAMSQRSAVSDFMLEEHNEIFERLTDAELAEFIRD